MQVLLFFCAFLKVFWLRLLPPRRYTLFSTSTESCSHIESPVKVWSHNFKLLCKNTQFWPFLDHFWRFFGDVFCSPGVMHSILHWRGALHALGAWSRFKFITPIRSGVMLFCFFGGLWGSFPFFSRVFC